MTAEDGGLGFHSPGKTLLVVIFLAIHVAVFLYLTTPGPGPIGRLHSVLMTTLTFMTLPALFVLGFFAIFVIGVLVYHGIARWVDWVAQ